MKQPLSPMTPGVLYDDLEAHDREVDQLIEKVNTELMKLKNRPDNIANFLPYVLVPLGREVSPGALLEIVYRYRHVGWIVRWSICGEAVLSVGISSD